MSPARALLAFLSIAVFAACARYRSDCPCPERGAPPVSLTVLSPTPHEKIDSLTVTVRGRVRDGQTSLVLIDGLAATVDQCGLFQLTRVFRHHGPRAIIVSAPGSSGPRRIVTHVILFRSPSEDRAARRLSVDLLAASSERRLKHLSTLIDQPHFACEDALIEILQTAKNPEVLSRAQLAVLSMASVRSLPWVVEILADPVARSEHTLTYVTGHHVEGSILRTPTRAYQRRWRDWLTANGQSLAKRLGQ